MYFLITYAFPDTLIFIIVLLYTCHLFNYYNFQQYCITRYHLLYFYNTNKLIVFHIVLYIIKSVKFP